MGPGFRRDTKLIGRVWEAALGSDGHRGRWLDAGRGVVALPDGRDDLRIVPGWRDAVLLADCGDRMVQQGFPIGADQPSRAAAATIAFEDRPPDRLVGP